ncbi:MAG: hypothetical protein PVI99_03170 [Anaerolineales bacterium]|jgi:hypothetical protein
MNEKQLKNGLQEIATEKISPDRNLWPEIQKRLQFYDARPPRRTVVPRWALSAFVAAVLVVVTATVPPVRAGFIELVEQIGGVDFTLTADYPGSGGDVTTIPSDTIPIEEILVEYSFSYPSWEPSGYSLEPDAQATWFDPAGERPAIVLTWRSDGSGAITLDIHPGTNLIIGLTEINVLQIQGQEVALWRGGWNYDTQTWDVTIPVQTMSWAANDLNYNLQAPQTLPVEDLVKMVESSFP